MFTVKVVHASGAEEVYPSVDQVRRITPQSAMFGNEAGPVDGVQFFLANGTEMFPTMGGKDIVYVMNEHGKTVATYHL